MRLSRFSTLRLSTFLGIGLIFIGVNVARANVWGDLGHSISSLWQRKSQNQTKAHTARIQAAKKSAHAEFLHARLEKTQRLMTEADDAYDEATAQLHRTELRVAASRKRIKLLSERYARHKIQFGRRLEAYQRQGKPGFIAAMLGAQSVSDLSNRAAIFETLCQHDTQLQADFKADAVELKRSHAQLLAQWSERNAFKQSAMRWKSKVWLTSQQQERDWKRLNNSRLALLQYAAAQEQSSREITSMIGDLEGKRSSLQQQYEATRTRRRVRNSERERTEYAPQLARRVSLSNGESHSSQDYAPRVDVEANTGGGAEWEMPARGRLSSRFGMRFHPVLRRWKLHTGTDIAASYGSPIRASHSGVVLWAGWKTAYGNAVIIDIGNGLTTLYGHASRLGVSAGQTVKAGQYLGNVGSTGFSTGPHLHFEIRRHGQPIDPLPYLHR